MILVVVLCLLLLVAGVGFMAYMLFGKKREQEQDEQKYIPTTQDHIPIDYIRSGIVKLKTGNFRMIVKLPSINIDLMEAREKQTILEQYRQILNAIDFPFQFLQQSRVVDVSEYLHTLERVASESKSKFIKNQLQFYSEFLVDLIKNRSVLTKQFYLVITYDEEKDKKGKRAKQYHAFNKKQQTASREKENEDVYQDEQKFERAKKQLYMRAGQIERSFRQFDITPKILNDKEILELYYTSYNKDRAVYQPLTNRDPSDYQTITVQTER